MTRHSKKPLHTSHFRSSTFWQWLKKSYIYLVIAIIYIPLIVIILLSFTGQTERGNINLNFNSVNFKNYELLFVNDEFINGLINSLIISVVVVPISVLIGIVTCFGIWNSKARYANTIMGLSKLSLAIPEPITAISLTLLFSSTWISLGFNFGIVTIILAHISFCVPYAIITIYPRMLKMNMNQMLASYDLGYSKTKTFFKIIIPYLMPAIFSACAITLAMSLDDFIITNLINGSTQTVSTAIYTTRKGIKAWVVTFGALIVMITIVTIIIISIIKITKDRRDKKDTMRRNYENK